MLLIISFQYRLNYLEEFDCLPVPLIPLRGMGFTLLYPIKEMTGSEELEPVNKERELGFCRFLPTAYARRLP
jgi:hypothetical protein